MIIGIDIDNTITPSIEAMIAHMKRNGHDIALEDLTFHGSTLSANHKGYPESFFLHQWLHNHDWLRSVELFPGAKLVLSLLQEHELHLISARGEHNQDALSQLTYAWLEEKGIVVDSINTATRDKTSLCKKLGIQIMIEDSPEEVPPLLEAGITVLLHDRKYNRKLKHPLLTRFSHWAEVPLLIRRILVS